MPARVAPCERSAATSGSLWIPPVTSGSVRLPVDPSGYLWIPPVTYGNGPRCAERTQAAVCWDSYSTAPSWVNS
jgi:hypothetical protein